MTGNCFDKSALHLCGTTGQRGRVLRIERSVAQCSVAVDTEMVAHSNEWPVSVVDQRREATHSQSLVDALQKDRFGHDASPKQGRSFGSYISTDP